MIIRNSLQLLEQLSELEERIRQWESLARAQGIELDSELLLRVAYNEFRLKKNSGTPPLTSQ